MKRPTALSVGGMVVATLLFAFGIYAVGWPEPMSMRYPATYDDVSGSIRLTESGARWMGVISIALALALFFFSLGGKNESK